MEEQRTTPRTLMPIDQKPRDSGPEILDCDEIVEFYDNVPDMRLFKLRRPHHIGLMVLGVALVALLLAIPLCNHFASPDAWGSQIASLNDKAKVVSGLSASSVVLSTGLSALPGDAASPIADKLADLSMDFALVLGAIYIEKYLLTITSLVSLRVLIPLGLLMFAASEAIRERPQIVMPLRSLSVRLVLMGIVVMALVPTSVFLSTLIEDTHNLNASAALQAAQSSKTKAQGTDAQGTESAPPQDNSSRDESVLAWLGGLLDSAGKTVTSAAESAGEAITSVTTGAIDAATNAFNQLVETLVILLVTSCAIPILTLILFVTLSNMILGTSFSTPTPAMRPKGAALRRKARGSVAQMRNRAK